MRAVLARGDHLNPSAHHRERLRVQQVDMDRPLHERGHADQAHHHHNVAPAPCTLRDAQRERERHRTEEIWGRWLAPERPRAVSERDRAIAAAGPHRLGGRGERVPSVARGRPVDIGDRL
jgi:hypothetical protein